jgi:hypothetical protein
LATLLCVRPLFSRRAFIFTPIISMELLMEMPPYYGVIPDPLQVLFQVPKTLFANLFWA